MSILRNMKSNLLEICSGTARQNNGSNDVWTRVMDDPYSHTEFLGDISGKLNLKGCRSARIDRNFRIIFVICEECRHIPQCEYCFCDNLPDNAILFLTVGPHDKAYAMR